MLPLITNIQKYSIHDGPGIRTTVFFKGCPMTCTWCHNPETQKYESEVMISVQALEQRKKGDTGLNTDLKTTSRTTEVCGVHYKVDELARILIQDLPFYEESGGGVTLSGGEVMTMDITYLKELLNLLFINGCNVGIDTCGYVSYERYKEVMTYIDFILYDLKIMDDYTHRKYTGVSNKNILCNLIMFNKSNIDIFLRIPVIGGVNDNYDNMIKTAEFLVTNNIRVREVDLIPYHDMGKIKYAKLNRKYSNFYRPDDEAMKEFADIFSSKGYITVIG